MDLPYLIGPLLCFKGEHPRNVWNVSVLCFARGDLELHYTIWNSSIINEIVTMYPLTEPRELPQEYIAYRYTFRIKMASQSNTTITYGIFAAQSVDQLRLPAHFVVPCQDARVRFSSFSCNGFHDPEKDWSTFHGIDPMWARMCQLEPCHLMVGNGDQLYADPVWKLPSLQAWLRDGKPSDQAFSMTMLSEVLNCYWNMYSTHFSARSSHHFARQLASTPYIFNWDDHDIFDGYGSYDEELNNSEVFHGIFRVAKFFYLLFQQHITEDELSKDELYIDGRMNRFYKAGDSAFLVLDTRSERTRQTVIDSGTYCAIYEHMTHVLARDKITYLYVSIPGPVVYPDLSAYIDLFDNRFFEAIPALTDQFEHVGFIDDTYDQWSNRYHAAERDFLVEDFLLKLQLAFAYRTVILTGDIHAHSTAKIDAYNHDTSKRRMYQICSSPIANAPMLGVLALVVNGKLGAQRTLPIGRELYGKMSENRFRTERNFCIFSSRPFRADSVVETFVEDREEPYSMPLRIRRK